LIIYIDFNLKINEGISGLDVHCVKVHIDIIKILIDKGIDINIKTNDEFTGL
jgi:hypothetical protein